MDSKTNLKSQHHPDWQSVFPDIAALDDEAGENIRQSISDSIFLDEGVHVFHEGDACHNFVFVIKGFVRVYKMSHLKRELMLYRVSPGEPCVLTTACLLADRPYPASSITECEVEAVSISKEIFLKSMANSDRFREIIFSGCGNQLLCLVNLVQGLAFNRVDERIAQYLIKVSEGKQKINITHQQIALEVGSVRAVVTRELDRFRDKGWIKVGRGNIEILDKSALSELILKNYVMTDEWSLAGKKGS